MAILVCILQEDVHNYTIYVQILKGHRGPRDPSLGQFTTPLSGPWLLGYVSAQVCLGSFWSFCWLLVLLTALGTMSIGCVQFSSGK